MPAPQLPAFDPHDVPESNATSYPEPHRAANLHRYNRRLGDHVGLQNYGVVMTRIVPGGQSSHRHAHSRQDEFIYVLEGEVTLESNSGQQITRGRSARDRTCRRWQVSAIRRSAILGRPCPETAPRAAKRIGLEG